MVGSEATGWIRVSSWTSPEKLIKLVDTIASASHTAPAGTANSTGR
jgi:hypothetical protein